MKLPILYLSPVPCYCLSPRSNISLSTLFSNTFNVCSSLCIRDQVSHPYESNRWKFSGRIGRSSRNSVSTFISLLSYTPSWEVMIVWCRITVSIEYMRPILFVDRCTKKCECFKVVLVEVNHEPTSQYKYLLFSFMITCEGWCGWGENQ